MLLKANYEDGWIYHWNASVGRGTKHTSSIHLLEGDIPWAFLLLQSQPTRPRYWPWTSEKEQLLVSDLGHFMRWSSCVHCQDVVQNIEPLIAVDCIAGLLNGWRVDDDIYVAPHFMVGGYDFCSLSGSLVFEMNAPGDFLVLPSDELNQWLVLYLVKVSCQRDLHIIPAWIRRCSLHSKVLSAGGYHGVGIC